MKNYVVYSFKPILFLAFLLSWALLFGGSVWLISYGPYDSKTFHLAWGLLWLVLGYFLVRKMAVRKMDVRIGSSYVVIQPTDLVESRRIEFDQIASYLFEDFNNNKRFRLRLQSGEKIVLRHNGVFCPTDDMSILAADFERQIAQQSTDIRQAVQREKTFFEKPVATVVLVVFSVLVAFMLWSVLHDGRPVRGGFFTSVGGYVAYIAAWRAAASRRNH